VPASWNDQFAEWRDYLGETWYQTHFDLPWSWDAARRHIGLRFGSANYLAEAWLNGIRCAEEEIVGLQEITGPYLAGAVAQERGSDLLR
jgi:beta-galactosidase/beta-glucuronidase